jgi:ubiquitin-conjugating enzyme E2 H
LNGEAAALLMREPKSYDAKVKGACMVYWRMDDKLKDSVEYVLKYANKDAVDEAGAESDDDDDMSSVGSFGDEDDEPAGTMEEV